jgi:hypothetical protein
MGTLLLILFFLPWVNVTCNNMAIGEASGYQLTVGDLSPSEEMEKMQKGENDKPENLDSRPWFILGLLVPAGIAVVGVLGLLGRPQNIALIVLGIVGMSVMVLATQVNYTEELMAQQKENKTEKPDDTGSKVTFGPSEGEMDAMMRGMIQTKTTGTVVVCFVLYALVIAAGLLTIVFGRMPAGVGMARHDSRPAGPEARSMNGESEALSPPGKGNEPPPAENQTGDNPRPG